MNRQYIGRGGQRWQERRTNRGDVSEGVVSLLGADQVVLPLLWFPSFQHWQKKKCNKRKAEIDECFHRSNAWNMCSSSSRSRISDANPSVFFHKSFNGTSEQHVHAQERASLQEKRRANWKLWIVANEFLASRLKRWMWARVLASRELLASPEQRVSFPSVQKINKNKKKFIPASSLSSKDPREVNE